MATAALKCGVNPRTVVTRAIRSSLGDPPATAQQGVHLLVGSDGGRILGLACLVPPITDLIGDPVDEEETSRAQPNRWELGLLLGEPIRDGLHSIDHVSLRAGAVVEPRTCFGVVDHLADCGTDLDKQHFRRRPEHDGRSQVVRGPERGEGLLQVTQYRWAEPSGGWLEACEVSIRVIGDGVPFRDDLQSMISQREELPPLIGVWGSGDQDAGDDQVPDDMFKPVHIVSWELPMWVR